MVDEALKDGAALEGNRTRLAQAIDRVYNEFLNVEDTLPDLADRMISSLMIDYTAYLNQCAPRSCTTRELVPVTYDVCFLFAVLPARVFLWTMTRCIVLCYLEPLPLSGATCPS